MPEWNETFAQSEAWVQLTFSGFVLTYGSFQLLYGPWSDRLGRQQVLLVGLFIAWLVLPWCVEVSAHGLPIQGPLALQMLR